MTAEERIIGIILRICKVTADHHPTTIRALVHMVNIKIETTRWEGKIHQHQIVMDTQNTIDSIVMIRIKDMRGRETEIVEAHTARAEIEIDQTMIESIPPNRTNLDNIHVKQVRIRSLAQTDHPWAPTWTRVTRVISTGIEKTARLGAKVTQGAHLNLRSMVRTTSFIIEADREADHQPTPEVN